MIEDGPFLPQSKMGAGLFGLFAGSLVLAAALVAQEALASGNDDSAAKAAVEHTVTLEGMQFGPETLTVKSGDRVTWMNKDVVPHTASSASGAFDSQSIAPGASRTYTAGKPGSYPYLCRFHPGMQGTLIVQ